MPVPQTPAASHGLRAGQFATTRWSVVLAAGQSESADSAAALEGLCQTYWQPVYAFVRRTASNPEDARDLTQGFFADLLQDRSLRRADPNAGRFRSFLLGALKHFLADAHARAQTQKRGGGVEFVPFDTEIAESRYGAAAEEFASPAASFDRGWALSLLDRGLSRLRQEFELSGRGPLFDGLKPFLTGDDAELRYSQAAAMLRISQGAAKMTVTRMRQRFRAIIRHEIAQTVASPEELEEELKAFVEALR